MIWFNWYGLAIFLTSFAVCVASGNFGFGFAGPSPWYAPFYSLSLFVGALVSLTFDRIAPPDHYDARWRVPWPILVYLLEFMPFRYPDRVVRHRIAVVGLPLVFYPFLSLACYLVVWTFCTLKGRETVLSTADWALWIGVNTVSCVVVIVYGYLTIGLRHRCGR